MTANTGGAGSKKFGRNLAKCKKYRDHQTGERNKLKRVLQSNGYDYAMEWAKSNGVIAYLNKMVQPWDTNNR